MPDSAYEGLQKALDANPEDQTLRLVLADWYEEQGDLAGAQCMRWLAENGCYPYKILWEDGRGSCYYKDQNYGWTRTDNIHRDRKRTAVGMLKYVYNHLPPEVYLRLRPNVQRYGWWFLAKTRRLAEEAAVEAWRGFLREKESKS